MIIKFFPKELVTMATRKVTVFEKIMPIDWEKGVIRGVKFMATKLIKELFMTFMEPLGNLQLKQRQESFTLKPSYTIAIENLYYSKAIILPPYFLAKAVYLNPLFSNPGCKHFEI